MKNRKTLLTGCVALAIMAGTSARGAVQPTSDTDTKLAAMQQQMAQMQAQLQQTQTQLKQTQDQLKKNQQAQTAMTPAEEANIVKQVIDDADKRTESLLVGGANAGFDADRGFYIQSDDGNSVLNPGILYNGQLFTYVGTHGGVHQPAQTGSSGFVQGYAQGSLFSKDLTYRFVFNSAQKASPEEAWAQYVFWHDVWDHDIAIRGGRYKNVAFKETAGIADQYQLFMTPSLASDLVGGGAFGPEVNGLQVLMLGDNQPLHAELSADGGSLGGDSGPQGGTGGLGFGVGAVRGEGDVRVDYKVFGDWADTTDMTGKEWGHHDLLDIGGGGGFVEGTNGELYQATVDAQYQSAQMWNLYGALYGDSDQLRGFGFGPGARNDWGAVIQGGYFLNKQWELIGRYSLTRADSHFPFGDQSIFHEMAVGVNYFMGPDGSWANHSKVSMEIDYLPSGTPSDRFYVSTPNGRHQLVVRGYYQLYF